MALPDYVAGSLRPPMSITWVGGINDLTGATISGTLKDMTTKASRAIAGALAVTDGPNLQFSYDPDAADVVVGFYEVQFNAAFPSGATPAKSFITTWNVRRAL